MILVGCGKSKLLRRAPARELYTGSLFRAARDYAEASGEPWAIVSAKYGLLEPPEVVAPYEHKLARSERHAWAATVGREFDARYEERKVTLLMGAEYAEPLALELSWRGVSVQQPLAGLMLGERLSWFKAQREKREGTWTKKKQTKR